MPNGDAYQPPQRDTRSPPRDAYQPSRRNEAPRDAYQPSKRDATPPPRDAYEPPSFKRGGRVYRTGIYKLHRGERVIPARSRRARRR